MIALVGLTAISAVALLVLWALRAAQTGNVSPAEYGRRGHHEEILKNACVARD